MKGPVILSLSLTVNFGLLGWFGLQLSHRSKPPPNPVVKGVARTISPAGPEHPQPPAASAPVRSPEFRWSQIESEDYPTYITNLRTIGCPEKTIRDIILTIQSFEPIYELAERQNLSNSAALQAYEIMKPTTDEITRARRDRTLSASKRRAQMEEIRISAEQALRQALGDKALADYLEEDAARWLASPVKR